MTIAQIVERLERVAIQLGTSGLRHYESELLEIAADLRRLESQ